MAETGNEVRQMSDFYKSPLKVSLNLHMTWHGRLLKLSRQFENPIESNPMFSFKAKLCHQHSARMSYCLVSPEPWVSTKSRFCSRRRTESEWNFSCKVGREGRENLKTKNVCTGGTVRCKQCRTASRTEVISWARRMLERWVRWGQILQPPSLLQCHHPPKMGSCADCLDPLIQSSWYVSESERADSLPCSPSGYRHTLYVYQWARRGDGVIQADR